MHVPGEENANIREQGRWTGGSKRAHIHPDSLGGNALQALTPIAKPKAEGRIQQSEPQSGKQQKKAGENLRWQRGALMNVPASRYDCGP